MHIKVVLSIIATLIAIISYIPYIRDILRDRTKPHAFSWLIWSLLAYIAGYAQLKAGGGIGASVALVTATIALLIAVMAYRDGTVTITRGDWISLTAALLAIPIWVITGRPLLSVILVSIIDTIGFWPTIRKSYTAPQQETLSTHALSTFKHCITIAALQKYNWTTVLYPASLAVTTALFVIMLVVRKQVMSNNNSVQSQTVR